MYNPETQIEEGRVGLMSGIKGHSILAQPVSDPNKPGFRYDPKVEKLSTRKRMPIFSFGGKLLAKGRTLAKLTSTPVNLGPNSYEPNYRTESKVKADPVINFPKAPRFHSAYSSQSTHESYAKYHSIGKQLISTKKTESTVGFGRGKRGVSAGFMPNNTLKLQLAHAKY